MASRRDRSGVARQLRTGAVRALRVLETCPLVPVDAFADLAGLSGKSSAYQQLARLLQAGLAQVRRVDPGYLVGERRLGCWTITDAGTRLLAGVTKPDVQESPLQSRRDVGGPRGKAWIGSRDLPLLIATYRLLASVVVERSACGHVEVARWEWPWVRAWHSCPDDRPQRVEIPAGALLMVREAAADSGQHRDHLRQVLFVPDLGSAPVVHYREMLRRLVTFCEHAIVAQELLDVVIATLSRDDAPSRGEAWLELFDRIARQRGENPFAVRVVTWDWVARRARTPGLARPVASDASGSRRDASVPARSLQHPLQHAPMSNCSILLAAIRA